MSLDVYLTGKVAEVECRCAHCDNAHTRTETEEFYSANITHNLVTMATEADIYNLVWKPEGVGITKAAQLIAPLRAGIALMESDPPRFRKHDPPNKWGSYDTFLPWLRRYLDACEQYPDADVKVSR